MPEEQKPKYRVEVDRDGCPRCAHDRLWAVVHFEGGEEVQESEHFGDEDQAEVLTDRMNSAYELALKESAALELLEACRYMHRLLTDMGHGGLAGAILGEVAIRKAEGRNA